MPVTADGARERGPECWPGESSGPSRAASSGGGPGASVGRGGSALVAALSLLGLAVALGPGRAAAPPPPPLPEPAHPPTPPTPSWRQAGLLLRLHHRRGDRAHPGVHVARPGALERAAPALTDDPVGRARLEWAPSVTEVRGNWVISTPPSTSPRHPMHLRGHRRRGRRALRRRRGWAARLPGGLRGRHRPRCLQRRRARRTWPGSPTRASTGVTTFWDQPLAPDGRSFAPGSSPTLMLSTTRPGSPPSRTPRWSRPTAAGTCSSRAATRRRHLRRGLRLVRRAHRTLRRAADHPS